MHQLLVELFLILEEISSQILDRVGWTLFGKHAHALQQNGHHSLIEVGANGQTLQVHLLLLGARREFVLIVDDLFDVLGDARVQSLA